MTPLKNKYNAINVDRNLMELVKLEYAMKKHFVYIDHIDELKHNERVIKDFDNAVRTTRTLIQKIKNFKNNLVNQ